MRSPVKQQPCLGDPAIGNVKLNTECRDEIIPILRALQHVYEQPSLRREILELVKRDVNGSTSRKHGRPGLDYWPIVVLAAVRLGCNLDYDKLQDLAEQHRALRQIMGISGWEGDAKFDWRRIRDNVCWLRPETLKKINEAIVAEGHRLVPEAPKSVRGDTFVVETNIHHPTESSLIADGLRKVVMLSARLADLLEVQGWRQWQHWLKKIKTLVRQVNVASRSKGKHAGKRLRQAYRELLQAAEEILERSQNLRLHLRLVRAEVMEQKELEKWVSLTQQVCDCARRRVLEGQQVDNREKIFSLFEEHTELIKRGKARAPVQFGHNVLVIEDAAGFICDYEVPRNGTLDQEVVVPVMRKLQKRLGGKIKKASFDRSFHTPENQRELATIVAHPCIAPKGQGSASGQGTVTFRRSRRRHPGVESAVGALQAGNGLDRARDRSYRGYCRYVGLGILGRNLHVLGKVLLAREEEHCLAGRSQRQPA
jgi:hypothetical protein